MNNKIRRYSGKLYFNETEHIDITEFILRDNEIGFSLASVSEEYGRWEAESGKPAVLQPDGSYLVRKLIAFKNNTKASDYWDIEFLIENEESPELSITVSGKLVEAGVAYNFDGELDASPALPHRQSGTR